MEHRRLVLHRVLSALLACAVAAWPASTRGQSEAGLPLAPGSVRLAAIGDMGTGDRYQLDVAGEMARVRATFPFDFVITLGDNLYTGSSPSAFEKAFAVPYKPLLDAGVTFYAVLGNHDSNRELAYPPFHMNGARYYTYTRGHVRFFALDSNAMDQRQLAWLESELRATDADDWKVCYFHHPIYSSARRHGSDEGLRRKLEPLFVRYGVDVALSGHDHVYERTTPQRGVTYFVEGASGKLRKGNLAAASPFMARGFDADRSFLLMEFAGDDLYFRAVSSTGATVDAGALHRD